MQGWLTNDQNNNPFNPNNPLDADGFCDNLQRYWTMKSKDEKVTKDKSKNKGDNTTQQNSQKKPRHNNSGGRTGSNTLQAGRGDPKAAAVITAEETKTIEDVAPSAAMRTIFMIDGAVILILTANVMAQRLRNVSTKTTRMAPTYGTGSFMNRTADSPMRSPLGLAAVKAVEEADIKVGLSVDAALIAAEAVDEAVVDSKAITASRAVAGSKVVDAATTIITAVAVAKIITTEIKVHIMEAPRKDLIIKAIRAAAASTHTCLLHSPGNKVT